jgi:hypothetical protein
MTSSATLWRGIEIESVHVSDRRLFYSYATYLGTEAALRAAGILREEDRLPQVPRGCTDRGELKIAMLVDGRLRVSLAGTLGARRDTTLKRLLAHATEAASSSSSI